MFMKKRECCTVQLGSVALITWVICCSMHLMWLKCQIVKFTAVYGTAFLNISYNFDKRCLVHVHPVRMFFSVCQTVIIW